MFQAQVIGNLGRDPELSYTPDGTAFCKFSVATSRKIKGEDQVTWINCTAWRNVGEAINKHFKKGQQIFAQGELVVRQYVAKDGSNASSLDLTIDKWHFAGGKKEESSTDGFPVEDPSVVESDTVPF